MKFIVFLLFPFVGFSQIKLEKMVILDNRVEILVPKDLTKMTNEMWVLKYPGREQPPLVLTDENGEINLIGEQKQHSLNDSQVSAYKDVQIATIKKNHPDVTFLNNDIKIINGKTVGYIKFISQAIDQKVFNYFFFTVLDGKLLFFSFNCIERLRSSWENVADKIVESLKIK